jgi:uncharacterized protein YkwD
LRASNERPLPCLAVARGGTDGETAKVIRRPAIVAVLLTVLLFALPGTAQALRVSRLIAPATACPHQGDRGDSVAVQERAMRCMANFARQRRGLPKLKADRRLQRSAHHKARDIVRCDSFSHSACGRGFTYWMRRDGYLSGRCWRAGENIAWGGGSLGTVRSIFEAWMRSPGHRENILELGYDGLGVGLVVGALDGYSPAYVWAQHFGRRC